MRTRIAHEQEISNLKILWEIKAKEFLNKMMEKAKEKFSEEMYSLLHQFEDTSNTLFKREKELEYWRFKLEIQEEKLIHSKSEASRLIAQKFNTERIMNSIPKKELESFSHPEIV